MEDGWKSRAPCFRLPWWLSDLHAADCLPVECAVSWVLWEHYEVIWSLKIVTSMAGSRTGLQLSLSFRWTCQKREDRNSSRLSLLTAWGVPLIFHRLWLRPNWDLWLLHRKEIQAYCSAAELETLLKIFLMQMAQERLLAVLPENSSSVANTCSG